MKSAREIGIERNLIDENCRCPDCECIESAIRAAQIDAAEWMREEAAKAVRRVLIKHDQGSLLSINDAIRAIKLPGDGE